MSGLPLPARPSSDLLSRISAAPPLLSRVSESGGTSSKPIISTLPARPAFALPSRPSFTPTTASAASPSAKPRARRDSLSPAPRRREEDIPYTQSKPARRDDVYLASPPRRERYKGDDRYEPDYRRRSPSPPPRGRYRSRRGASELSRSPSPVRASRARSASRSRSPSRSYRPDRSPPPSSERRTKASSDRTPPPANFVNKAEYHAQKAVNRYPKVEEPVVEKKHRPPVPDQAALFHKARLETAAKEEEERDKLFAEEQAKRAIEKEASQKQRAEELALKQKALDEREALYAEERARKQKLFELRKQSKKEEKAAAKQTPASPVTAKRPLSPTAEEPLKKVPKPIPTGPRGDTGLKFPFASRPAKPIPSAPTGPRTITTAAAPTPQPPPQSRSPSPTGSDGMYRGRGRGRGSASSSGRSAGGGRSMQPLALPEWDEQQIMQMYGSRVAIKDQWLENPKAPLANYLGGGGGGATNLGSGGGAYKVQEGLVGSKRMFRVSVVGDPDRNIIGVGDHTSRKEAEKLAALSAVLQLQDSGLLEQGRQPKSSHGASAAVSQSNSSETATLTDGSIITYDRARQFMEYYCKRYKFGKPDIDFTQSQGKSKKGRTGVMQWEAVMTVGGRKIGMGQATNKKNSQIKCYLDVTQYLESCDQDLWRDFSEHSKKDQSADIGLAPHLIFQMSDELNEDVQGLIGDVRHSLLLKNAPTSGVSAGDQPMPSWGGGRSYEVSEAELERKSIALQDKLADYHSDPRLVKMRAQRTSLPVTSRATDILAKIEVNDVTIVMAATGSGKTTQIPQLLFDDYINRGQGAKCNIICTQPRRLAAMSVAERIADERGDRIGVEIGYQVRFDVKLPQPNGSITFCTTGIFLKRMQSSLGVTADAAAVAAMDEITHIVVDEVHERDIDTDLLLVVLKRLLSDRKARGVPLKVILMSATIDPTLFQRYFADSKGRLAPVAEVPGRTFPVERHYLDETIGELQKGLPQQMGGWVFQEKNVAKYLQEELSPNKGAFNANTGIALEIPYPLVALMIAYVMQRSDDGHVLVFLPGWDEIKKVADILLDGRSNLLGLRFNDATKYSIHYLHSSIPAAEQKEVFRDPAPGVRRIILATNIAETSITIPNVVYVVDTGRVKEKRYDPERHMSSLVSAWVGSSNLNQRAGRAGRHREGEYFGLVSKNRLESLDPHQLVEMKRSDLSNVVMHVKALNLGEVGEVLAATIEPPERSRIVAAMDVLRMLGALDADQNLTSLGRVLLQLPIDAAMGKMCLYGSFFRCLDSALTLAAVLTNRDPFLSPLDKKVQADEIKDSWSPRAFRSDPLAIVAAYNVWTLMDDRGDYQKANYFCGENFLSKPTLLQIKQVKASLLQSLDQAGVIAVSAGGNVGRLGRRGVIPPQLNEHSNSLPMLAALIAMAAAPNFALRTSEKTCRTAQDKVVMIHGSSVNSRRREVNGPEQASASFNPAEKRLYAFQEKGRNVSPGQNPNSAPTQLRTVTRLDPMTYMLFGAHDLVVTQRGMECDRWLPVTGNLHALDDVQRLKDLLDACMLRVFEGVGKSLVKGRDQRWVKQEAAVTVRQSGSSRIDDTQEEGNDEGENESDDEDTEADKKGKRVAEPLSLDEIKELEMLTSDVVRILDAYSAEREGNASTMASRAPTPGGGHYPQSGGGGYGQAQAGFGNGGGSFGGGQGGNGQVYRPPAAGGGRKW